MADVKKTSVNPTKAVKKTTKVVEVKTLDQLKEDLIKAQTDLTDSRRSHAQGELVNPHILSTQRKGIARLKTAILAEQRKESM